MLLVKDDVGKAKPTTRNLPPNRVFGKANRFDESAADGKSKVFLEWMSDDAACSDGQLPVSR